MAVAGAALVALAWGIVAMESAPKPLAVNKNSRVSIPWLPETVTHWQDPINEMAQKYDIDPDLLAIITTMESGGFSKAVSPAIGAQGLMQIAPPTAGDIARKYLHEPVTSYDMFDPRTNIEFGAAYLSMLRDEFGEPDQAPSWDYTVELIAASYNGGPGNGGKFYRGEGLSSEETVAYARDALNMWRERDSQTSPTFERWAERGGQRLIDRAKEEQAGQ